MRWFLVVCFSLSCLFSLSSLEKRAVPLKMRTSVIVPCHYKHFSLLPELLNHIVSQTVLPDEVVISLQLYHYVAPEKIKELQSRNWPFSLKIVLDPSSDGGAGKNRNLACENSTGDLLICNDADDLPHPRRIEIIKYLFENFYVELLLHRFYPGGHPPVEYAIDKIESITYSFDHYSQLSWDHVHNGNMALARHVLDLVQWSNSSYGEDVCFNYHASLVHKYKVGVCAFLVTYRPQFSIGKMQ